MKYICGVGHAITDKPEFGGRPTLGHPDSGFFMQKIMEIDIKTAVVQLRKTKITKAVWAQIQEPTKKELLSFDVLGWVAAVSANKKRYKSILLYSQETGEIRKKIMHADIDTGFFNGYWEASVNYSPLNALSRKFKSEIERRAFIETLDRVKANAVVAGQIFL